MQPTALNSVQPDLGGSPGWDLPKLADLLTLTQHPGGGLTSSHAEVNANGTIFGGQLIGQAIAAASHDIPEGMAVSCLQLCFLAPGQTTDDLSFAVKRLLNGRSFLTQHVLCTQAGKTIFSAHISFHRGEPGPDYEVAMPGNISGPEDLPSLRQVVLEHADALKLSDAARARIGNSRTLEIRPVDGRGYLMERQPEGRLQYWIRASQPLPMQALLHQAVLGYLSDYWFPLAALTPHLENKVNTGLYIASLNHAIWFHAPFKADDWLLIDAQVLRTVSARGLCRGSVYTQDGRLVASLNQETLFRGWDKLPTNDTV